MEATCWNGKSLAAVGLKLKDVLLDDPSLLGSEAQRVLDSILTQGDGEAPRDVLPIALGLLPDEGSVVAEVERLCATTPFGKRFAESGMEMSMVGKGAAAWLWLVVLALNVLYCEHFPQSCVWIHSSMTVRQNEVVDHLLHKVLYFVCLEDSSIPNNDWETHISSKRMSYSGEAVLTAQDVTWAQLEPALPPKDFCACVNVMDISEGSVRDFFANPAAAFIGHAAVSKRPRPGKVMAPQSEMAVIARGLLARGMVRPLKRSELVQVGGGPLLNGWFGVTKGKTLGPECGEAAGKDVLRFIMNLTATNEVQTLFDGDIATLPYIGQWRAITLREEEVLMWSAEDLKGCFYIFRLPDAWAPWFAFDVSFSGAELGLADKERYWLGAIVLPMGWKSAMGIAQYLHRRLLTCLGGSPQSGLLPHARELRKDRATPILSSRRNEFKEWWQVYCDDLDIAEVAATPQEAAAKRKELHEWQVAARDAYHFWNVPRSEDKSVVRSDKVKRLGGLIDGSLGAIGPDGPRCGTVLGMTLHLLGKTRGCTHDLQVVGGNWTCNMVFAKETSVTLGDFWQYCHSGRGSWTRAIPSIAGAELLRTCLVLPLMRMDLRAVPSNVFTVSDASEWGGGVCASSSFTKEGRAAFAAELGMQGSRARDELGLVSLCGGIGAARRAFDLLEIELAVFVLAECDDRAVKVVRKHWPEVVVWEDVCTVSDEAITRIGRSAPNLKVLFVEAGFPCQDLSGANATGLGLGGQRSSLVFSIWHLRRRIEQALPWVQILTMVENVQSMDSHGPQARLEISALTRCKPVAACSSGLSEVRRPRYYWLDWPVVSGEGVEVHSRPDKVEVRFHMELPPGSCWLERGWQRIDPCKPFATFMRAIPRTKPPFMPCGINTCDEATVERWTGDQYRYPPYQYKSGNLVHKGSEVRPLNSRERAVRMGFDRDHVEAAVSKREHGMSSEESEDIKCSLIGNSFHCVVVAWCFGQALTAAGYLEHYRSPEECWGALSKTGTAATIEETNVDEEQEFGRLVTTHFHKNAMYRGSDVRLTTGLLMNPGRWPRESVPIKRFQWKVVLSFSQGGDHINALELKAVAAAIRWRLKGPGSVRSRAVHFTDSQVCQSVLVKGRSSSRRLRSILQRVNALILSSGLVLAYGYVTSELNPADRPSRWVRRR